MALATAQRNAASGTRAWQDICRGAFLLICTVMALSRAWSADQGVRMTAMPHNVVKSLPRMALPPTGMRYHGVFPGTPTGEEDAVSPAMLDAYERAAGKQVAWVYFSSEWGNSQAFPRQTCNWISARGSVPFIRLMLRSSNALYCREQVFTLERIIAGKFDTQLTAWGKGAREYGRPLLVEFGTECNGAWFSWNGEWHGRAGTHLTGSGPARFIAAYRRVVNVMRAAGASNITWVFHIAVEDDPQVAWNAFERYYPGEQWVDWLAVSVYGAGSIHDRKTTSFRTLFDPCYRRLIKMAPQKPIVIAEFGCPSSPNYSQEDWADAALADLTAPRWPQVIGFAWWNSRFLEADHRSVSNMLVAELPDLQPTMRTRLADPRVLGRPLATK